MKKIIITITACAIVFSSCSSTKTWRLKFGDDTHFRQRAAYKKAKIEKERIERDKAVQVIK